MKISASFGMFALTAMLVSTVYAQTPSITGPGNSGTVAFWYFGPHVSPYCCNDITNKFYTIAVLNLYTNGNPSTDIQWFINPPGAGFIVPNGNTGATVYSFGTSGYHDGYDIAIWATVGGVQSNLLPTFINTPYKLTNTGLTPNVLGCPVYGYQNPGFVEYTQYSISDLIDETLVPIDLAETLENPKGNWPAPRASTWPATTWVNGSQFQDTFAACGPGLNPQAQSYGQNGTTIEESQTQKFWVGTLNQDYITANCEQIDAADLYIDHFTWSQLQSPLADPPQCAQGSTIN